MSHSFAEQHANADLGYNALYRWFRRTDFWQSLRGEHRAVLDELYHKIARLPLTLSGTQIDLKRGQWAISLDGLAEASGTSVQQVRTALAKAKEAGIIQQATIAFRTPRLTQHLSLFTWVDFDLYDAARDAANKPSNTSLNTRPNNPSNTRDNNSKTQRVIPKGLDPKEKTQGEERAASPLTGPDGPSLLPAGFVPSEEAEDDAAGTSHSTAEKRPKAKAGQAYPLSDDDKVAITASLTALAAYYLHGREAVRLPQEQWAALPPTANHWAPQGRKLDAAEAAVGLPALAAFACYRVNCARASRGEPLRLLNFKRMLGTVKNLLSGGLTREQAITHIDRVGRQWIDIQARLGTWGEGLALDETILTVPQVIAQAERLGSSPASATFERSSINTLTGKQAADFAEQLAARTNSILI
ncbi:MAG: hypothetical protein QM754_06965 [Tepidisphaeraceae bacterium]